MKIKITFLVRLYLRCVLKIWLMPIPLEDGNKLEPSRLSIISWCKKWDRRSPHNSMIIATAEYSAGHVSCIITAEFIMLATTFEIYRTFVSLSIDLSIEWKLYHWNIDQQERIFGLGKVELSHMCAREVQCYYFIILHSYPKLLVISNLTK